MLLGACCGLPLALRAGWPRMAVTAPSTVVRYAVLVDAENTQYSRMEYVMEVRESRAHKRRSRPIARPCPIARQELAKYGATSIRLVYGDFTKQALLPWRSVALNLSFRSVNAFSFTSGKGSSDT
eukprot:97206-Prymnesium_polylepis.1